MNDNFEDIYDKGTPWDLLVDMSIALEKVINAHNELAKDHEQVVLALKRAELHIQELRRDKII
jgi:hypothetical protein